MKLNGAKLFINALKAEGIRHLFGVSGSASLPIMDVLFHEPEIRYIQSQHEQGGMYMANGYARATGNIGVCLVSPGPGATNCLSGVAQAFYTSTSSLLVCIEEGTRHHGLGTSLHHDLEAVAVFKPVTKLSLRVERVDRLVESVQAAFRTALSGRRGPVYLGIAHDVLADQAEVEVPAPETYRVHELPGASAETISRAADLLEGARMPVALAGGGLLWARAHGVILELAELLAMPVAATRDNKGLVPEDHPLSLGSVGLSTGPPASETMQKADVLLAVGCTFGEFTTKWFGHEFVPQGVKIIQVDIDPAEIGKIYPVTMGIHGDAGRVLKDLVEEIKRRKIDRRPVEAVPRIQQMLALKKAFNESLMARKTSDRVPLQWPRVLHDLRRALPRDAIVSANSGITSQWFNYAFEALSHTCATGGWHPMGAEYSESLGVKVALPDRVVVCLTGDGSLMMNLQEIATAAAYNINLLCIVSHNNVFGNMRYSQIERFGGRFFGTDLPVPNLANIANEFGAYGERVTTPDQIIPAIGRALGSGKPGLLEIMTDISPESLAPGRTKR